MPSIFRAAESAIKSKKAAVLSYFKSEAERYASVFDAEFYRAQAGKHELSDSQALRHYLNHGWQLGLDPSPSFSTNHYLASNLDVHAAGVNPLTHYVKHGIHEVRSVQKLPQYKMKIDQLLPDNLQGWCIDEANPGLIFDIQILIDGLLFATVNNDQPRADLSRKGISEGLGGFGTDLLLNLFEAGEHTITIQTPDGNQITEKIETPKQSESATVYPNSTGDDVLLKIVVPIYNAAEDVAICIERLKMYTPQGIEIILIDDRSPDPVIRDILETVQNDVRFRVLANSENMGFTRTVNRGLKEAQDADVIILNSDARVTPKWTEGLRAAAYSRPKVATVTAMSDRAGAFSAPNIGNDNALPPGIDEASFARAFRRRSLRLYPEVPTGNGFCMYIRRAGLDTLGSLDEEAFPRGYGEENDYCMRALRAGWLNLIDDATYVFHERTKSFGETKTKNISKGRQVVDQRYPEYKILIGCYHTSPQILVARYRARMALADCNQGAGILPRAVYVTATQTGGTPQTNADLMGAMDDAFETWVLRCDSRVIELSHYENGVVTLVRRHVMSKAIEPAVHRSSEYDAVVANWLNWLEAEVVHIRHLAWHSLSLPELAKRSGAKVFYSLHDFYTLCPSLKLLDENNVFCGGVCTPNSGTCQIALWKTNAFPNLKNAWVHQWRDMMAKAIEPCDGFVTTSPSARERVLRQMPSIPEERFHVIPHGRDFDKFEQIQSVPSTQEPIRILIPGNIDAAKGLNIITEVLRLDVLKIFEFHILGGVHVSLLSGPTPRLIQHGRYQRQDFARKVREIEPHFGAILSIWDETFCHTLTEMWSVGLPVAVLDFPTLRARVENSQAGWVIDDITPSGVHAALTEIANDPTAMRAKGDAAVNWQSQRGAGQSCRLMASSYLDVYRTPEKVEPAPNIAVVVPTKTRLQEPSASSEIRVWERTRNRLERRVNYIRMDTDGLLANIKMGEISGAIIQRTAIPARAVHKLIETAKAANIPYIFEIDDDLFEVPSEKDKAGFYASYAPFLSELISNAAAVTVSTGILAEKMRPYNDQVEVIHNKIPSRLWGGFLSKHLDDTPRLLYMGTKTHDEDLVFVLPAIELARATHPNLRLSLIGVTSRSDLPDWVDVIPLKNEAKNYSQFVPWIKNQIENIDLAIAPLMDGEFNRFKSGLKILDYAALGLPVLASEAPSYRNLVGSQSPVGITLIPNNANAWAKNIVMKINQRSALHNEGHVLREWVFKNHTLEPSLEEYDEFVLRVIGV
tara:strand:+ start:1028 stop:4801 length:3774 start_codon:yes stop_codon:yes gene_type:complete